MAKKPFLPTTDFPEVLTVSRFYVELKFSDSKPDAYFMECKGIQYSQDVIEVCEVTPQKWGGKGAKFGRVVRTKIPGNSRIANITLKRGLMDNSLAMWEWMTNVQNSWSEQRLDSGKLVIYTQDGKPGATFTFTNAWPVRYSISDINVGGGELAIEELEIAVEEFQRTKG